MILLYSIQYTFAKIPLKRNSPQSFAVSPLFFRPFLKYEMVTKGSAIKLSVMKPRSPRLEIHLIDSLKKRATSRTIKRGTMRNIFRIVLYFSHFLIQSAIFSDFFARSEKISSVDSTHVAPNNSYIMRIVAHMSIATDDAIIPPHMMPKYNIKAG